MLVWSYNLRNNYKYKLCCPSLDTLGAVVCSLTSTWFPHVGAVFANINRLQLYIDLVRSYSTFYAHLFSSSLACFSSSHSISRNWLTAVTDTVLLDKTTVIIIIRSVNISHLCPNFSSFSFSPFCSFLIFLPCTQPTLTCLFHLRD